MSSEKCFCHLNGYAVKDATARRGNEELKVKVNLTVPHVIINGEGDPDIKEKFATAIESVKNGKQYIVYMMDSNMPILLNPTSDTATNVTFYGEYIQYRNNNASIPFFSKRFLIFSCTITESEGKITVSKVTKNVGVRCDHIFTSPLTVADEVSY